MSDTKPNLSPMRHYGNDEVRRALDILERASTELTIHENYDTYTAVETETGHPSGSAADAWVAAFGAEPLRVLLELRLPWDDNYFGGPYEEEGDL